MATVQQVSVGEIQLGTTTSMQNATTGLLKLYKSKDWAGNVEGGSYPPAIAGLAPFFHKADPIKGSKGAVVYSGANTLGVECAWLFAWYSPNITSPITPNQVYADCGRKEDYNIINWDVIEKRLDVADRPAYFKDLATGTIVQAEIKEGDKSALLSATFSAV